MASVVQYLDSFAMDVERRVQQHEEMNTDRLFDRFARTDERPARQGETTFTHLSRRAGVVWDNVRNLLEEWFAHMPTESRADVHSRLRTRSGDGFRSAFFEMYCHEVLRRSGWDVTAHPHIAGTSRHPDFTALRKGTELIWEVTTTSTPSAEAAAAHRDGQIIDGINERMEIGDFVLLVEIEERGDSTPRVSMLCARLQTWLESLDADAILADRANEAGVDLPTIEWASGGWRISFSASPLEPQHRGPGGRIIGSSGVIDLGWIDDVSPLRRQLQNKSSAYGSLLSPYIIAVDTVSDFAVDGDVISALYGTNAVRFYMNAGPDAPAPQQTRLTDGLWRGTRGWRRNHVSAVLTTFTLMPWTVGIQTPTLWLHPSPDLPVGDDVAPLLRVARVIRPTGTIECDDPPVSAWQFFGLHKGWPY